MANREIKLKVHDESELFTPMDPDQNILSDDAIAFLSREFLSKHRRLRENYVIRIMSDTPLREDHVRNAIRNEFNRQKDDIRFALKRMMLKLICLAILGAAILSLWLYLSATTESVGIEILSIMGWVCVWEATSIAVLQRPDMRRLCINLDRLTRAEIIVQTAAGSEEDVSNA